MDMSTMSSISMFSMYFVICLGRGVGGSSLLGGGDATRFLQLAQPSFPSVSTRTFFQIQFTTWPGRATSYCALFFLGGAITCKMYERPALESVIGRRRALYNKRYQGDLLRLEKSDMKSLMASVFASTILFSNYGPTLSID